METIIQPILYVSWGLWLSYCYAILLIKRKGNGTVEGGGVGLHTAAGMLLSTITIFSLFFFLTGDFKSDSNFFIENYRYPLKSEQKEIIIGSSEEGTDITIENPSAAGHHLGLIPGTNHFEVQDISENKRVDLNGRYLDRVMIKVGDAIEIGGKETFKVESLGPQYPLGRSITFSVLTKDGKEGQPFIVHTLLDKSVTIRDTASLTYETGSRFLGTSIYYMIVFFMIFLLSVGIYLYLKNRFNGALLLLMMASLPFGAGFISTDIQGLTVLLFVPLIVYIEKKRRTQWKWGAILVFMLYASVFFLPVLLGMEGDFTLGYVHISKTDTSGIRVLPENGGQEPYELFNRREKLAYGKTHRVILGHTLYGLRVEDGIVTLSPRDPEKIKISHDYHAIIDDLSEVKPGFNYVYLKFPHEFVSIPSRSVSDREKITVTGKYGGSITLSKIVKENYRYYLLGLILIICIPFWFFWWFNRSRFNTNNFVIYNFVYFMLGLGYVVFGGLALYNNSYLKNFSKFRAGGLPLFVVLFLGLLLLSRYNRVLVFLYRLFSQKRYHVPFLVSVLIALPSNYSSLFLIAAVVFFGVVFGFRLRRGIIYEYVNSRSYPLDIKKIIETPVCNFEEKENQRLFFGLGGRLNRNGWNYLLIADLLLLLALFFIVLQLFLGSELGVSVGGFFFLPIELGKILLTLYFADWVSRIDKGMSFNILWVYGLVLIPFGLLIVFLKDFSPFMVFAFVLFYHIIKIKKFILLRILLIVSGLWALREATASLGNYSFPYRLFAVGFSISILFILLRVWFRCRGDVCLRSVRHLLIAKKVFLTVLLGFVLAAGNYVVFTRHLPVPRVLADRVNVWLNPWEDYNLSYQYINSLWLMKDTGTFGKSADALTAAARVPLIEKDLSFTLYVSVLGTVGVILLFLTLFLIAVVVIRRAGPRWHGYVLEFLSVIFFAQMLLPAMYVVGLLPLMGQPQPFLSYSNNLLLLFALPFSFLMIVLSQNQSVQGIDSDHYDQKFLEVEESRHAVDPALHGQTDSGIPAVVSNSKGEHAPRARRRFAHGKYILFCLVAFLITVFVLLRLYSISYPKDIEEKTDIVYLESFHDDGNLFKLDLRDNVFYLTPLVDHLMVRGKETADEVDIHNGDLIAVDDHKFQFKVYPGEYSYKEFFCRPVQWLFPTPKAVKYIGGWLPDDRQKMRSQKVHAELLKKTIVEISPEVFKRLSTVSGAVLELHQDRESHRVKVKPLMGSAVRLRDWEEKIVEKDTYITVGAGDIFKIVSVVPGEREVIYLKFDYRKVEGADNLTVSYRRKEGFPLPFSRRPEAAVLKSLDSGIAYDINLLKETLFMGKLGLFSFNVRPGDLINKLYIPDKIPQGRVVDLRELLDRDMYYRQNNKFFPVNIWFLNNAGKHFRKGKGVFLHYLENAGIKWREFMDYSSYESYAVKAAALLRKMQNKGIYQLFAKEIERLNRKGTREEELTKTFQVQNNRVFLRQKQAQRPTFKRVEMPQRPVIFDAEKNILAFSSQVNGENGRFYSLDVPPDLLYLLGSKSEETWGLEQIFSPLYRENRVHEIRLNVNLEWQKIALTSMGEILAENRETELNNPVYVQLKKEREKLELQLAQAGKNLDPQRMARLKEVRAAIDLEKNRFYEAAVVLMDDRGRILTAASYPYDEETLVRLNPGISQPYLRDINPHLNRAWKWKYNPGSTAKILDSIAFLCSRERFGYLRWLLGSGSAAGGFPRSDLKGSYMLNGKEIVFQLRNFREHDVPPGHCSLAEALIHSYNTYFAYLGIHNNSVIMEDSLVYPRRRSFIKKSAVPVERMYREYPPLEFAERLLMNRKINLLDNFRNTEIHEGMQRMPNDAFTAIESVFPVNAYTVAEVAHYSIGQGDFQLTALQNALVASTVLNDGILYLPSFLRSVTLRETDKRPRRTVTPDPERSKVRVFPAEVAGEIRDAMQAVVNRGTAGGVFGDLVKDRVFYAKTGTAETEVYKDNALFMGFVRFRNGSHVVFSVIVPRSGLGARIAGKLTADIFRRIVEYENQRGNPI